MAEQDATFSPYGEQSKKSGRRCAHISVSERVGGKPTPEVSISKLNSAVLSAVYITASMLILALGLFACLKIRHCYVDVV